jgi:hypothetical protein
MGICSLSLSITAELPHPVKEMALLHSNKIGCNFIGLKQGQLTQIKYA